MNGHNFFCLKDNFRFTNATINRAKMMNLRCGFWVYTIVFFRAVGFTVCKFYMKKIGSKI